MNDLDFTKTLDERQLANDEFRDIDGFSGYQISRDGRVRSLKKDPPIIMKHYKDPKGYHHICLYNSGRRTFPIHRLVAIAFVPGRSDERNDINHKNGNPSDNCADNLEWVSQQENSLHARDHAEMVMGVQKLDASDAVLARALYETGEFSVAELAAGFKVTRAAIWYIINNKTYIRTYWGERQRAA